MIFCRWAFFVVVQVFTASVAALSTLSISVIGVFSRALLLGEALSLHELIALCLVVVPFDAGLPGKTVFGLKPAQFPDRPVMKHTPPPPPPPPEEGAAAVADTSAV